MRSHRIVERCAQANKRWAGLIRRDAHSEPPKPANLVGQRSKPARCHCGQRYCILTDTLSVAPRRIHHRQADKSGASGRKNNVRRLASAVKRHSVHHERSAAARPPAILNATGLGWSPPDNFQPRTVRREHNTGTLRSLIYANLRPALNRCNGGGKLDCSPRRSCLSAPCGSGTHGEPAPGEGIEQDRRRGRATATGDRRRRAVRPRRRTWRPSKPSAQRREAERRAGLEGDPAMRALSGGGAPANVADVPGRDGVEEPRGPAACGWALGQRHRRAPRASAA